MDHRITADHQVLFCDAARVGAHVTMMTHGSGRRAPCDALRVRGCWTHVCFQTPYFHEAFDSDGGARHRVAVAPRVLIAAAGGAGVGAGVGIGIGIGIGKCKHSDAASLPSTRSHPDTDDSDASVGAAHHKVAARGEVEIKAEAVAEARRRRVVAAMQRHATHQAQQIARRRAILAAWSSERRHDTYSAPDSLPPPAVSMTDRSSITYTCRISERPRQQGVSAPSASFASPAPCRYRSDGGSDSRVLTTTAPKPKVDRWIAAQESLAPIWTQLLFGAGRDA